MLPLKIRLSLLFILATPLGAADFVPLPEFVPEHEAATITSDALLIKIQAAVVAARAERDAALAAQAKAEAELVVARKQLTDQQAAQAQAIKVAVDKAILDFNTWLQSRSYLPAP